MRQSDASDTELEVLKVLWEKGPGTVRDVEAQLKGRGRQWAYTTIQTLLNRLHGKGLVAIEKRGTPHVYKPRVSREKLLGQRLKDLARSLCDGTATPLVHALVSEHRFTPQEIDSLRKLLDDLESAGDAPPGSG